MLYQLSYVHHREGSRWPTPKPAGAFGIRAGRRPGLTQPELEAPILVWHPGLAPREGLEPPTQSLEGSCSIRLSYRGLNDLEDRHEISRAHFGGRGRGIRTPDILLPKQVRYQTAPYPAVPGPDPDA